SANVEIGEVWAIQAGGPPIQLTADGGSYDLLELQNGVMTELASAELDASIRILQLRLHVLDADVTLGDDGDGTDYMFASGGKTQDLFIPSGAQSGIKINLRGDEGNEDGAGVDLVPGETILAVVDMDVEQNFVFTGDVSDPTMLPDMLFTPLLRATVEDVAGSISGTVTYASATPDEAGEYAAIEAVLDLTTSTVPVEEMETATASAIADPVDGSYTIYFLSPGTYDVSAEATIDAIDYTAGPTSVEVGKGENVTGVDFSL
ncbi:MAG: DUF4382 domain-containing protein, partial [marine benthic group bacterium]|nr:DUF4382 domain-containing protein [Gemmatimonadota bacterium]